MTGARACYMLRQKAKGHRLGEVEFHIGAGPLQRIVRQGAAFSQFCQSVPDRIEVPAGGIFGGEWITGQNRIDNPPMRLKQNGQVGPAAGERVEVEPGDCIGSGPPRLSQPRHIGKADNRLMKLAICCSHCPVVTPVSSLLQALKGCQQRLPIGPRGNPLGSLLGGEGIKHSAKISRETHQGKPTASGHTIDTNAEKYAISRAEVIEFIH